MRLLLLLLMMVKMVLGMMVSKMTNVGSKLMMAQMGLLMMIKMWTR